MPNLNMNLEAVNGGKNHAILTGKTDLYNYSDNQRVGDAPIGTTVTVALPGNRLAPLKVKILGGDPLPQISDDAIAEACSERKFVYVRFKNCTVKVYNMSGSIGMSATAEGAELLKSTQGATTTT